MVLLHGPDQFLAQLYTAQLRELLTAAHGDVDTITYDGLTTPCPEVLDECRSFGLMQQHKLVVVDNADQFVKDEKRALVERYVQGPPADATLVLRSTRWNKGKLDAMIAEVGAIIDCDRISEEAAVKWATKRARERHRATIELDAAQLLVERVGGELGRIDSELAKLAAAAVGGADETPVITRAIVVELVGVSRDEEVWGIQSFLLGADARGAIEHLRELVDVSRQPAVLIMFAYTDLARKLHAVCQGSRAGANPWSLAGKLKLWGPSKDAILKLAPAMDAGAARALFGACVECDARSKSGLGDPVRSLEMLSLRFGRTMRRR